MYGIFTYKTGSFLGQMLVNITHMEHMGVYIIYIYILDRMTSHILGFEATVCTSFSTLVPNFLEACQYSQDIGMTGMTLA
jgi:hypothetical protein